MATNSLPHHQQQREASQQQPFAAKGAATAGTSSREGAAAGGLPCQLPHERLRAPAGVELAPPHHAPLLLLPPPPLAAAAPLAPPEQRDDDEQQPPAGQLPLCAPASLPGARQHPDPSWHQQGLASTAQVTAPASRCRPTRAHRRPPGRLAHCRARWRGGAHWATLLTLAWVCSAAARLDAAPRGAWASHATTTTTTTTSSTQSASVPAAAAAAASAHATRTDPDSSVSQRKEEEEEEAPLYGALLLRAHQALAPLWPARWPLAPHRPSAATQPAAEGDDGGGADDPFVTASTLERELRQHLLQWGTSTPSTRHGPRHREPHGSLRLSGGSGGDAAGDQRGRALLGEGLGGPRGGRGLAQAGTGVSREQEAHQLAECLNRAADQAKLPPITWDRAMRDELASLRVHAVWQSAKPAHVPLTVVTQLSASRLSQLSAQCKGWKGPLSAAIYVPLLEEEQQQQQGAAPAGGATRRRGRRAALSSEQQEQQQQRQHQQVPAAAAGQAPAAAAPQQQQQQPAGPSLLEGPPAARAQLNLSQPKWVQATPGAQLSAHNLQLLQLAEQAVAALHASTERNPFACALSAVLVYEVVSDPRAASLLYPVNQLRNTARLQATTEVIAQLDVDMLISGHMTRWLEHSNNSARMVQACRDKSVFVLPAFETHGKNTSHSAQLSDKLAMQSKRKLAEAMAQQLVTHFDALRFPQGHNTTNFTRWFAAKDPYFIDYTYRYEPWLVVHRQLAPWHDVRFRGYGNNKIQQVSHLNATGHLFQVHPVGFIIHRAHALTEARKQLINELRAHSPEARKPGGVVNKQTLYGHTKALFEAAKDEMDRGTFAPVVDPGTQLCSRTLPWYTRLPG